MSYGADIEARDKLGNTPLIEAALNGEINSLQTLIKAGIDIDAQNNIGYTALMGCTDSNRINALQALLAENVNIDITEKKVLSFHLFKKEGIGSIKGLAESPVCTLIQELCKFW